jgi:hypothetical protein
MTELHATHAPTARPSPVEMRTHAPAVASARHSPFVPLLLMGLALLGWTAFETLQLARDRQGLDNALAAQAPQIAQAQRLRASLSALASDTQTAADAGDSGAQLIVNQLRKRGITIHPGVPDPTPP